MALAQRAWERGYRETLQFESELHSSPDPKKAHIAQLTAFCQELQVKQAQEEAGAEEGETEWGGAEVSL